MVEKKLGWQNELDWQFKRSKSVITRKLALRV